MEKIVAMFLAGMQKLVGSEKFYLCSIPHHLTLQLLGNFKAGKNGD